MKKIITYESFDGETFDTEEECLEHENSFKIPNGVVMADYDDKIIEKIIDDRGYNEVWYIKLPTIETVNWFINMGEYFGFSTCGIENTGIFFWNATIDEFVNIEYEVKEILEKEKKLKELLNGD